MVLEIKVEQLERREFLGVEPAFLGTCLVVKTLRRAQQKTYSTCSIECGTYYDVNIKQWECTYDTCDE